MIILQHTNYPDDTFVHDDGKVYTNGKLNKVGNVEIVGGKVVRLNVKGGGTFDVDATKEFQYGTTTA